MKSATVAVLAALSALHLASPAIANAPSPPAAIPAPAPTAAEATTETPELEEDGSEADAPPPSPIPPPPMNQRKALFENDMFYLPGGPFTEGSKVGAPNERPPHVVTVKPFWIDRTEVTVAAYRACVDKGTCVQPAKSSQSCTYDRNDPRLPVSCVHWDDADRYCRAVGKRLPHESEWEYAARGTAPIRFPWGGTGGNCTAAVTLLHEATGKSCGGKGPMPVGTHPAGASPFGVLDLSGNVEEWTDDWYAELQSGSPPRSGASHVLRGGGWMSTPSMSRTTARNWGSSVEAGPNVGFRCARDPR
jgi:formylglycine-generating enzyme required for sulfatase activity